MANLTAATIEIKGATYEVETFAAVDTGNKVVRLTAKGKSYDVEETAERTTCTCPDWTFRHADLPYSDGCKHIKSVVAIGLLENGPKIAHNASVALAV